MHVVELTDDDAAAYEHFVAGRDEALFYYSPGYRRFLTRLLGCDASYRMARTDDGRVCGILPLMRREGPLGAVYNSLPFYGSNGGILADSADACAALADEYNALVRADGVAAATLVGNPVGASAPEGSIAHDVTDKRIGQFSDLAPWRCAEGDTSVPDAVEASAHRNVKKAARAGVTVHVANDALQFLEACHRENMAAMGGRAKVADFFRLIPECFEAGADYRIYLAEHEGRPVAALLLFYYNGTVEYYTPVTQHDARSVQPMALILATAMRDAANQGMRRWNWGGTWLSQGGVYRFKKKWGAVDYPYRYLIAVNNRRLYDMTPTEIRDAYGDFYVIPFSAAAGAERTPST